MREIKFRAWDRGRQIMTDVTYINFEANVVAYEYRDWSTYVSSNEVELMQYTGLDDVNGIEIYEGDILKAVPVRKGLRMLVGAIEVEPQLLSVAGQTYDTELYDYEVIGNEFQNPELLEGNNDERKS